MQLVWNRKTAEKRRITVHEEQEVVYLTFPVLENIPMLRHGFSTRIGGVSEGMFSSMNLSFERGDDREHVYENFRRMANVLGSDTAHMVFSRQTHTTNVRVVTEADRGKGIEQPFDYTDTDALVTDEPGIMLVTFYADCVPVYLADPKNRAIGLCHSGWRGTAGKIAKEALRVMNEQYGTQACDVAAAIGPSICADCYEVSEDVVQEFEKAFGAEVMGQIAYAKGNGKYRLDLWRANALVLEEAGVPAEQIETPDLCTCCNAQYLFSHRATQGKRGNLAAFLAIHEQEDT